MRIILALLLSASLLSGCMKANVNTDAKAEANVDAKAEIQTQVETFLKAHLESLIKAQIDTKVQGVGIDVKNKLADQLTADITAQLKTELDTKMDALYAKSTQNTGMFAGGAIYVVIVAVIFLVLLFGSIIYLVRSVLKWKRIWHLISQSIEECSKDDELGHIHRVKSHFATALQLSGLKGAVDQNLQKRGLRKNA